MTITVEKHAAKMADLELQFWKSMHDRQVKFINNFAVKMYGELEKSCRPVVVQNLACSDNESFTKASLIEQYDDMMSSDIIEKINDLKYILSQRPMVKSNDSDTEESDKEIEYSEGDKSDEEVVEKPLQKPKNKSFKKRGERK